MRPLPRFWTTRTGTGTDRRGRPVPLVAWGWSWESAEEAARVAGERLRGGLERLRTGRAGADYYPRTPVREETVQELTGPDGELVAVVTRNRYGAEVLNTDALLVADVDLPAPGRGLFDRMLGRPGRAARAEQQALERVAALSARHLDWGVHVYRTAAGLRVLLTGTGAPAASQTAEQVLTELHADPLYTHLCGRHGHYRARLTPKPWRVGQLRMPVDWPRPDPADQERFARWRTDYERACRGHAVCRALATAGPDPDPLEARLLALHDEHTGVGTDLPLA